MNAVVDRVSVWSVIKIGCVFQMIVGTCLGIPTLLFFLSAVADMIDMQVPGVRTTSAGLGLWLVVAIPIAAIITGIGWGIVALLLNLAMMVVGGLQIRLKRLRVVEAGDQDSGYKSKFGGE